MSDTSHKQDLQSSVVYTIAEAARLSGLSRSRVRRWALGYSFRRGEEIRSSPPVIHSPDHPNDGAVGLGFLDLIEIRYVKAFVEAGVSWRVLRAAHEKAAAMLSVDHPFATKKFFTDGHTILTRIDEPALLDLMGNQLVFNKIVGRYLAGSQGLDFDGGSIAVRWWPMGKKRSIVIDPRRSFGQPIVSTEGVPTAVLSRAYMAERAGVAEGEPGEIWTPQGPKPGRVFRLPGAPRSSEAEHELEKTAVARVASWYRVEKRSVLTAVEYEASFLAAA